MSRPEELLVYRVGLSHVLKPGRCTWLIRSHWSVTYWHHSWSSWKLLEEVWSHPLLDTSTQLMITLTSVGHDPFEHEAKASCKHDLVVNAIVAYEAICFCYDNMTCTCCTKPKELDVHCEVTATWRYRTVQEKGRWDLDRQPQAHSWTALPEHSCSSWLYCCSSDKFFLQSFTTCTLTGQFSNNGDS